MEGQQPVRMDYVLDEYKKENILLTQELMMLRAYTRALEEQIKSLQEQQNENQK